MQMEDPTRITNIVKVIKRTKRGEISQKTANFLQSVEQTKSFDKIFLRYGVEEADLAKCIEIHQIMATPDWQGLYNAVNLRMTKELEKDD